MIRACSALLLVSALLAPGLGAQTAPAEPPASPPASPQATPTRADTAGRIVFTREVYAYPRDGRRDPFASLIATGDIRPIFADLVITGITHDPTGRNSVALLQDVTTGEMYRARVGSVFGRLRVTAIRQREISVSIDEFGFTRQETLSINVPSPAERTP